MVDGAFEVEVLGFEVDEVGAAVVVVATVVDGGVAAAMHAPFNPKEAITDAACAGDSPSRSGTKTVLGKVKAPLAIVTVTDAPFKT